MTISNSQDLLDNIFERQKIKFGPTTVEELYNKIRGEIVELQQANLRFWNTESPEAAEDIMFEEADIIILANRLYQEFHDEIGWALLSKYYNFETAKYVKAKWEIVEKRSYIRDKNGQWQHVQNKREH